MDSYDWIIGACCSDANGVLLYRFRGSKDELKEKLLELINEDKHNDIDNWDCGCEIVEDIVCMSNGCCWEYYGYGCYSDYHIDYTAVEFAHLEYLKLN